MIFVQMTYASEEPTATSGHHSRKAMFLPQENCKYHVLLEWNIAIAVMLHPYNIVWTPGSCRPFFLLPGNNKAMDASIAWFPGSSYRCIPGSQAHPTSAYPTGEDGKEPRKVAGPSMQSVHPSIHGLLSLLQLFPLPHKGGGSYPICEPVLGNPLVVSQHPLWDYIQATTIQWDIVPCVCVWLLLNLSLW